MMNYHEFEKALDRVYQSDSFFQGDPVRSTVFVAMIAYTIENNMSEHLTGQFNAIKLIRTICQRHELLEPKCLQGLPEDHPWKKEWDREIIEFDVKVCSHCLSEEYQQLVAWYRFIWPH